MNIHHSESDLIVKPGRYLILLEDNKKRTVSKVQKELNVQLTSSEELGSEVRAHDIYNAGNGIIFKNFGVAVVDNMEIGNLKSLVNKSSSPVIYWEEEKAFFPVNELDLIKELQTDIDSFQLKLGELEKLLKAKRDEEKDKDFSNPTWGVKAVNLAASKYTGAGVDVCILDTGLYVNHPDFTGRSIIGKSFITNELWDFDGNGHGTHCTGTACGNVSHLDGKRYGIANQANIVIGKVLSDRGSGSTSGIVDAIDWAIEKKYQVVSMSLGSSVGIGEPPSPLFEHIGNQALANNVLLIAAAGNDSRRPNLPRPVSSPANAKSIMAIAALDSKLNIAYFSNAGINASDGGKVDIAAPGVDVFSSYSENANNGSLYATLNGTSMATPHIAGLAALYFEAFPNKSASEIWFKLEKEAKHLQNQLLRDVGQGLAQAI